MAAAIATAAGPWTERRRRTAELKRRQPFAGELLDLYGALLPVQETAFLEARATPPSPDRLAAYVAELVVPAVVDATMATAPDQLRTAVDTRLDAEPPREMVARWIKGEEQALVDRYLARASLQPVLEALRPLADEAFDGPRDARHCPGCGGPPQLSYFAMAGEDLATGPRYLVCARCHSAWGYARMTCAGCGEDSSAKLLIFSEEGTTSGERGSVVRGLPGASPDDHRSAVFPHVRVEACESCRRYILSIDLASDPNAVPEVDELAAIPLDLYARGRGFSKIIPNLMGF